MHPDWSEDFGYDYLSEEPVSLPMLRFLIDDHDPPTWMPTFMKETTSCVHIRSGLHSTRDCFARGTPVHVRDGLKPIDELRAGDWVLSAPQDGTGTPAYRRVASSVVHQERTIRKISTYAPESGTQYFVSATGGHPFWVEGKGWMRADELGRHTVLRGVGGTATHIDSQWPVYRTGQPGIGWVQVLSDAMGSYGGCFDYEHYDLAADADYGEYPPPGILESAQPFLTVTVYGIEVEEYHTYFVGYDGIWVSDANRGS